MPAKQRKRADSLILAALAAGKTAEAAAVQAGVSVITVKRRLADPRFKARLEQVGRDMVERSAAALTAASEKAIATLQELAATAAGPVRLGASRSILEMAFRARTGAEFEARLAALEERLRKREARGGFLGARGGVGPDGRPAWWPNAAANPGAAAKPANGAATPTSQANGNGSVKPASGEVGSNGNGSAHD